MIVKIIPKDPNRKYHKSNDIIPIRYAKTDCFENFNVIATESIDAATDLNGSELKETVRHLERIWGHVATIEAC